MPIFEPADAFERAATGPDAAVWIGWLLDSYRHWTGAELIHRASAAADCATLFESPRVVLSHGEEPDPILNYGNRAALALWETDWETFTRMPSRLTAEPVERAERLATFERVHARGYVNDYRGTRVSTRGRRFRVDAATVWTIRDPSGTPRGHAATFAHWQFLD